jgi:hypothetical protein
MESTRALRSLLDDVPVTLLSAEATGVLDGVVSSLDIIERTTARRPVVVLVGPTGAGKSYVFNAVVGGDASPEGVLRPTTATAIVAGDPAAIADMHLSDATVIPRTEMAVTLIDMPEQDGILPDVAKLVSDPDLVVMVISPIRYADAAVVKLWKSLDPSKAVVVLNRVATAGEERPGLVSSVMDLFGTEPYVIGEGGEDVASVADHISGIVPDSSPDPLASIMFRTVVAGTRFIVRDITNAAIDIGETARAIEGLPDCVAAASGYDVQVTWDGTRDGIVERVAIKTRDRDDDIVRGSGSDLAQRILDTIGPWDSDEFSLALDTWHERCISTFLDASSIRWRRSSAEQMVRRFSWSAAINSDIVAPKRFSRILGGRMNETTSQMQADLEKLTCETLDARVALWQTELDQLGEYQPGALASAADAVESQRPIHD